MLERQHDSRHDSRDENRRRKTTTFLRHISEPAKKNKRPLFVRFRGPRTAGALLGPDVVWGGTSTAFGRGLRAVAKPTVGLVLP